ncbi:MAG: hypothetical protein WA125_12095 [Desulfosporosinus sp.]
MPTGESISEVFVLKNPPTLVVRSVSMVLKDKLLINAGSVGKPKHGDPHAIYALISFARDVTIDFRKVPYDYEATATAIEESELPNEFAQIIRTGKYY